MSSNSHKHVVHILGVGGTLMAGLAVLAKAKGCHVKGLEKQSVYDPMATFLAQQSIPIEVLTPEKVTYLFGHPPPNQVIVGNAFSRGHPYVEAMLAQRWPFVSAPQWLQQHVLAGKHVLAVSGTHGKTTTAAMLAWILTYAGYAPGFLIGGIVRQWQIAARWSASPYFVIEADEYDTAFFDKRPKFLHYFPQTLVMNNIEFDHADIYDNLAQIQKQFGYLLRTLPASGAVIYPGQSATVKTVLDAGCWSRRVAFSTDFGGQMLPSPYTVCDAALDQASFTLQAPHLPPLRARFASSQLGGYHNICNAVAAIAASAQVGVCIETAVHALASFPGVKRRMEYQGKWAGVTVYHDFAHHPTAISATLSALYARCAEAGQTNQYAGPPHLVVISDFSAFTLREGHHTPDRLVAAYRFADQAYLACSNTMTYQKYYAYFSDYDRIHCMDSEAAAAEACLRVLRPGTVLLITGSRQTTWATHIVSQLQKRAGV